MKGEESVGKEKAAPLPEDAKASLSLSAATARSGEETWVKTPEDKLTQLNFARLAANPVNTRA